MTDELTQVPLYLIVNDLIGGFDLSLYDKPVSEHAHDESTLARGVSEDVGNQIIAAFKTARAHLGCSTITDPTVNDLVLELRERLGLFAGAMPIPPKQAWKQALDEIDRLRGSTITDDKVVNHVLPAVTVAVQLGGSIEQAIRAGLAAARVGTEKP